MLKLSGKVKILVLVSALVVLFSWALPVLARPRGITDRGPLTRITFIHYARGYAKPPWAGGGKDKGGQTKCYDFLAKGAKWKSIEPYLINPTNQDGMSASFVESAVNAGVSEWETYGGDIFGAGSLSLTASYNNGALDGVNSTSFGFYPDPDVIAVTTVWGFFQGPPKTRELVEWDILFNDSFTWGDGGVNPTLMDLQNIGTHELGHSAGLADIYETSCNFETMYGFSSEGETIKRDLNDGDIVGIKKLY